MNELFNRRSVRKFLDAKVETDKVDLLLKAAMYAPSAMDQRAWEFIVVDDRKLLCELSKVSEYAALVADAPMAVIVLGNRDDMTVPSMWEQDLGACVENMMLGATSVGLGSCWVGVAPMRDRMNAIADLFDLCENLMPFAIVAIGYPETEPPVRDDRWDRNKVHYNGY